MKKGSITITPHPAGNIAVQIELANGTVWLTKHQIADLFNVYIQTITTNLRGLFKNDELIEKEVTRQYNYTNIQGIPCTTQFYNLDAIIALAFRIKTGYCRHFRKWVQEQVKQQAKEHPHPPIIIQLNTKPTLA